MRPYSRDDGRNVVIIRRLRDVFAPTAPLSGHPYRTRQRYGLLWDVGGLSAALWATKVYNAVPGGCNIPPTEHTLPGAILGPSSSEDVPCHPQTITQQ